MRLLQRPPPAPYSVTQLLGRLAECTWGGKELPSQQQKDALASLIHRLEEIQAKSEADGDELSPAVCQICWDFKRRALRWRDLEPQQNQLKTTLLVQPAIECKVNHGCYLCKAVTTGPRELSAVVKSINTTWEKKASLEEGVSEEERAAYDDLRKRLKEILSRVTDADDEPAACRSCFHYARTHHRWKETWDGTPASGKATAPKPPVLKTAAARTTAPITAPKATGSKAIGSKAAASKAAASNTIGSKATASNATGSKALGPKAIGPKATGSKALASKAPGPKAAVLKTVGSKAVGPKAAGPKVTAAKASGPKATAASKPGPTSLKQPSPQESKLQAKPRKPQAKVPAVPALPVGRPPLAVAGPGKVPSAPEQSLPFRPQPDLYSWDKVRELNSPDRPTRIYYQCTQPGCPARKAVDVAWKGVGGSKVASKSETSTLYGGAHNHDPPLPENGARPLGAQGAPSRAGPRLEHDSARPRHYGDTTESVSGDPDALAMVHDDCGQEPSVATADPVAVAVKPHSVADRRLLVRQVQVSPDSKQRPIAPVAVASGGRCGAAAAGASEAVAGESSTLTQSVRSASLDPSTSEVPSPLLIGQLRSSGPRRQQPAAQQRPAAQRPQAGQQRPAARQQPAGQRQPAAKAATIGLGPNLCCGCGSKTANPFSVAAMLRNVTGAWAAQEGSSVAQRVDYGALVGRLVMMQARGARDPYAGPRDEDQEDMRTAICRSCHDFACSQFKWKGNSTEDDTLGAGNGDTTESVEVDQGRDMELDADVTVDFGHGGGQAGPGADEYMVGGRVKLEEPDAMVLITSGSALFQGKSKAHGPGPRAGLAELSGRGQPKGADQQDKPGSSSSGQDKLMRHVIPGASTRQKRASTSASNADTDEPKARKIARGRSQHVATTATQPTRSTRSGSVSEEEEEEVLAPIHATGRATMSLLSSTCCCCNQTWCKRRASISSLLRSMASTWANQDMVSEEQQADYDALVERLEAIEALGPRVRDDGALAVCQACCDFKREHYRWRPRPAVSDNGHPQGSEESEQAAAQVPARKRQRVPQGIRWQEAMSAQEQEPPVEATPPPAEVDPYIWEKTREHTFPGKPFPRVYYKCCHPGCPARKAVDVKGVSQHLGADLEVTHYGGAHTHEPPSEQDLAHPHDVAHPAQPGAQFKAAALLKQLRAAKEKAASSGVQGSSRAATSQGGLGGHQGKDATPPLGDGSFNQPWTSVQPQGQWVMMAQPPLALGQQPMMLVGQQPVLMAAAQPQPAAAADGEQPDQSGLPVAAADGAVAEAAAVPVQWIMPAQPFGAAGQQVQWIMPAGTAGQQPVQWIMPAAHPVGEAGQQQQQQAVQWIMPAQPYAQAAPMVWMMPQPAEPAADES